MAAYVNSGPAGKVVRWLDANVSTRPSGNAAAETGMCGVHEMTAPQSPSLIRSTGAAAFVIRRGAAGRSAAASAAKVSACT